VAITGTDRGTGSENTSTSSLAISPTSNFTTGSTGILAIAIDNGNTTTSQFTQASITDSAGNIWYKRTTTPNPGSTGNGNSIDSAIYVGILTNGFTTGDNVTVSFSPNAITAKTWTLSEAAPATAGNIVIVRVVGATASVSVRTSDSQVSGAAFVGDMVFAMAGIEAGTPGLTADSDTTNGTWSTAQTVSVGSGTSGMTTTSQYKIQTTQESGQTYDISFTSNDEIARMLVLSEVPPKTRLARGPSTTDATTTVTFEFPIASGSLAVLCLGGDNANTTGPGAAGNFPSSLTDSRSNTWTRQVNDVQDPGAANAGAEVAIYTSVLSTGIQLADTVGITYVNASVVAKCVTVFEFSDATAHNASGSGGAASTSTPSVTTSSITNGHYVIGFLAAEGNTSFTTMTDDSDTSNGSWSTGVQCYSGTSNTPGATVFLTLAQYKKVTATGTQTYNPGFTGTSDLVLAWSDLTSAAASTDTSTGFFNFFT